MGVTLGVGRAEAEGVGEADAEEPTEMEGVGLADGQTSILTL